MEKAAPGPVYRLLRVSCVGCVMLLGGCFPQTDRASEETKQVFAFSGSQDSAGVNRTEKGDAMLGNAASVPGALLVRAISRAERATDTSPAAQPGAAVETVEEPAPSFAPANDIPATVALSGFYRALAGLEKGQAQYAVTILHLGDSHIAADRFSGDLREQFQSRFGSAGRGLLMPGMYLARGVKFDQGGKWTTALSTGPTPGPYGVTGMKIAAGTRDDWLRVTATDRPFTWTQITLQTGPDQGSAVIGLDGDLKLVPTHAPTPGVKSIRLERSAREIVIRPKGDGLVTVHGVAIGEQKPGIRYINMGLAGATAATPLGWDAGQVGHDLQHMAPDLIVVGYGTEESFDDTIDIRAYEAKVKRTLAMLRQAAPRASLLVMGPPDVARQPNFGAGAASRAPSDVCRALSPQERANYSQRIRNADPRLARWHPPLRLDDVRQALRRAAGASGAFFWDWSKLMGGTCGMHAWVHSEPALAANDHIHLTEEGSKRSARQFFRELMTGYDAYDRPVAAVAVTTTPTSTTSPPPVVVDRPAKKPAP